MKPEDLAPRLRLLARCEQTTRVLCRRSGLIPGWSWSATGRRPPLPFWEQTAEPGLCRVCGQPIYRAGSWRRTDRPRSPKLTWHSGCVATYWLWMKPADYAAMLCWRQGGLCPLTGDAIGPPARDHVGSDVEVDHELPIYRVRRDLAGEPWWDLIRHWGLGNLRALSRAGHLEKSAREAAERRHKRENPPLSDEPLLV